ncbi:MAG: type II secretion system F family protein [bacterium]
MPLFHYKAKNINGHAIEDFMEAENEDALMEKIHRQDAICIWVKRVESPPKKTSRNLPSFHFVNKTDLHLFTHQLAAMFAAGVPLPKSLDTLARDTKNKKFREIITTINRRIEIGDSLSEAMGKYPWLFDKLYTNLIRSGEESGTLAIILPLIATYIERVKEIRSKIVAATIYPLLIIFVAFLCLLIIAFMVLPQFAKIYKEYKVTLPVSTRLLFFITTSLKENIFLFLILILLCVGSIILLMRIRAIRLWWDNWKLRLPIIGPILLNGILSKFTTTLGILLKSGLPIIQSIELVSESVTNEYLNSIFKMCSVKIQEGASIAEAFSEHSIFSNILIQFVSSGEESGTLSQMLSKAGDFYQRNVNDSIAMLTPIIEPILIMLIAAFVIFMVISIFLPIFRIGSINL